MFMKWMKSSAIVLTAGTMLFAGCSTSTGTNETKSGTNAGNNA